LQYHATHSYVTDNTDCDDTNATVWRSGVLYRDADGDGYTTGSGTTVCYGAAAPSGYAATRSATDDCDDTNGTVWRSQLLYRDADGDGYTTGTAQAYAMEQQFQPVPGDSINQHRLQ
jgi:hypothetical protein